MKKTYLVSLLFLSLAAIGQTKKQSKPNSQVTINSLIYYLDNLKLENADDYFLSRGYRYDGSPKMGDTITVVYKMDNSFTRISLHILNNKKIYSSFYTNLEESALNLLNSAKRIGFVVTKNVFQKNIVITTYKHGNYLLMSTKRFYPEDHQTTFTILLCNLTAS